MNIKTLATMADLKNKFGNPVELVKYRDGSPTIYGIPVRVSPSMPNIGASNVPVVLGDFSYWCTRLIQDDGAGLMLYREAPGLVERGEVALKVFARADGVLAYTDTTSPSPFIAIQNHS
jgi:HK97 family phage major capsid protein